MREVCSEKAVWSVLGRQMGHTGQLKGSTACTQNRQQAKESEECVMDGDTTSWKGTHMCRRRAMMCGLQQKYGVARTSFGSSRQARAHSCSSVT